MKKIIILAFDCNPFLESESLISFKYAFYLSKENDVTVITRSKCKNDLQKWEKNNKCDNLHFVYVDSKKYDFLFSHTKGIIGLFFLGKYIDDWLENAVKKIRKMISLSHYDVIYKAGPNSFRQLPDLHEFRDCKRILGPVGGAQEIPRSLMCLAHGKNKFIEYFHKRINQKTLKSKKYKYRLNQFDKVLCCNEETFDALFKIYEREDIKILTDVGIDGSDIECGVDVDINKSETKFLWVGRFVFRKGLDLLIDSVKEIKNLNFTITLVGDGPDYKRIKKKISKYKLDEKFIFVGRVEKNKVGYYYKTHDCFLFPSLRESGGNVLVEALAKGMPIISLAIGGARIIVNDSCGYLIDVNQNYDEIVKNFSNFMKKNIKRKSKICKKTLDNSLDDFVFKNKIKIILDD